MNTKILIAVAAVVIVAGGAYYFLTPKTSAPSGMNMTPEEMTGMNSNSSGMLAEDNAVMVSDQRPGTTVSGTAVLAAPGYLVIHADSAGAPGAVLGSSALLRAGENAGVNITLSRATKDGETLHAMLHSDTDGNGAFNASKDMPVQSTLGGPIHGTFQVSSSASGDVPMSM